MDLASRLGFGDDRSGYMLRVKVKSSGPTLGLRVCVFGFRGNLGTLWQMASWNIGRYPIGTLD